MSKFVHSLLLATLFVSSLSPNILFAQQEHLESPDFGVGRFDEVAESMEKLIKLEWNGENIGLARNWHEELSPEEKEEAQKLEQGVLELVERGVPEHQAKRFAAEHLGLNRNFGRTDGSPFDKLFFGIAEGGGGRSRSSNGNHQRLSFSSRAVSGSAKLFEEDIRLSFEETTLQQRVFEFRDNGAGEINFRFEHGDLFVRLRQNQDGHTHLIWIKDEQSSVYVGKTFQQFTKNNPLVTERALFPLFARLGIKMAIDKTEPRVISNVVAKIEHGINGDHKAVRKLIKELGSEIFETRENASRRLADGYAKWASIIKEHIGDSSLSPEAEFRLNEIVKGGAGNEVEKYIADLNLLDSPEYLVLLLRLVDADEKPVIVEHLEALTKQSHGDETAAWQKWLEDQK